MLELLRSPRRLLLFLFEGVLVALSVVLASCLRMGLEGGLRYLHLTKKAALVALVFQGALYYSGLYDMQAVRSARTVFERVLRGVLLGSAMLLPIFYVVPWMGVGRGIFLTSAALAVLVLPAWRIAYNRVSDSSAFYRRAIVMGHGALAQEIAQMVRTQRHLGLELVGLLTRDRGQVNHAEGIIATYRDLFEVATQLDVSLIIVAYPDRRGTLPVDQLLECKFRGVEVMEGIQFYERECGKLYVRELKPSQLIFAEGFNVSPGQRRLKRILDVVCATIGLILAAPLLLLTITAIKLESRGPVLYRQVRAGQFGKLFTILKFRSMRIDAEAAGAQFAQKNDPRVTAVGRFIRKTRLDELPQLWNVLQGDMSMVGPRPERPVFIEKLEQQVPYFKQRLYVKPGVTGHAQVRAPYGATTEDMIEKLQYDLFYIKSCSVLFDLSIMFDTVKVVLFRIGSR